MNLFIKESIKKSFQKTEARCIMLGLDVAGKTSIIYKLQKDDPVSTSPMQCFYVQKTKYKELDIDSWDLGSQDCNRAHLFNYFANTQGLIFVVDSDDIFRIDEARDELHKLLIEEEEEELRDTVLLVFANKQDLQRAVQKQVNGRFKDHVQKQVKVYLKDSVGLKNKSIRSLNKGLEILCFFLLY